MSLFWIFFFFELFPNRYLELKYGEHNLLDKNNFCLCERAIVQIYLNVNCLKIFEIVCILPCLCLYCPISYSNTDNMLRKNSETWPLSCRDSHISQCLSQMFLLNHKWNWFLLKLPEKQINFDTRLNLLDISILIKEILIRRQATFTN